MAYIFCNSRCNFPHQNFCLSFSKRKWLQLDSLPLNLLFAHSLATSFSTTSLYGDLDNVTNASQPQIQALSELQEADNQTKSLVDHLHYVYKLLTCDSSAASWEWQPPWRQNTQEPLQLGVLTESCRKATFSYKFVWFQRHSLSAMQKFRLSKLCYCFCIP